MYLGMWFTLQAQDTKMSPSSRTKGQKISKQNCRAVTSLKKQMGEFVFLSWRLRNTWNLNRNSRFKYFWVVRIKKQIRPFFFFGSYVTAWEFCFEIYWPLRYTHRVGWWVWLSLVFPQNIIVTEKILWIEAWTIPWTDYKVYVQWAMLCYKYN